MHRPIFIALALLIPLSLILPSVCEAQDISKTDVESIVRISVQIKDDLLEGKKATSKEARRAATVKARKGFKAIRDKLKGVDDPGVAHVRKAISGRVLASRRVDFGRLGLVRFVRRLQGWGRVSKGTWGREGASTWTRITGTSWDKIDESDWSKIGGSPWVRLELPPEPRPRRLIEGHVDVS